MKRYQFFLIVCVGILFVGLGLIGCGNAGQPGNSEPYNGNGGSTGRGACRGPLSDRPEAVRLEIENEIADYLKSQLGKSFQIKAVNKDGYLVLYVEGAIYGTDGLKDFADKINDFSGEGCIRKIIFLPEGSIKSGTYLKDRGFEWSTCPHPTQPCSGGICAC